MMIQIKSRYDGHVIYEGDHATTNEAVAEAVRKGSYLGGADLDDASLCYASSLGASLNGAPPPMTATIEARLERVEADLQQCRRAVADYLVDGGARSPAGIESRVSDLEQLMRQVVSAEDRAAESRRRSTERAEEHHKATMAFYEASAEQRAVYFREADRVEEFRGFALKELRRIAAVLEVLVGVRP